MLLSTNEYMQVFKQLKKNMLHLGVDKWNLILITLMRIWLKVVLWSAWSILLWSPTAQQWTIMFMRENNYLVEHICTTTTTWEKISHIVTLAAWVLNINGHLYIRGKRTYQTSVHPKTTKFEVRSFTVLQNT